MRHVKEIQMHNFDFSEADTEFWHVLKFKAENSQNEIQNWSYAC